MLPLIHLCPSGRAHVPASMLGHDRGPLNIGLGYDELCALVGPCLHGILSEKLTWSILMPRKSHRNHASTSIGVWRFSGLQGTIFRTHWCGLMDRESVSEQSRQARWWQERCGWWRGTARRWTPVSPSLQLCRFQFMHQSAHVWRQLAY